MSKEFFDFIDSIKIYCRSGNGGMGVVHFRREKFVQKGGPDGGDGGKGGDIIIRGNRNLYTLFHLRHCKHIKAENGKSGEGGNRSGGVGKNIIVEVPLGTIVKDIEKDKILDEIIHHREKKILLKGGKGGMGNTRFKSATRQTPRYAQPGLSGKELWINLELKILADVGLVGFPNAGKSTLLSVISSAKPKIADYPFTTLTPNLGVVKYYDNYSFVVADIPGIIKGASQGKGLGIHFLRHIERNTVLLLIIPADSNNIRENYKILLDEIGSFNSKLLDKKRLLAISKSDLIDNQRAETIKKDLSEIPFIFISSITQYGINILKDKIWEALH